MVGSEMSVLSGGVQRDNAEMPCQQALSIERQTS